MADAYFVQTNRQYEDYDEHRLFEEVGVAVTFSNREEWGEQLAELSPGDIVIAYDVPEGEYVAVGTVQQP